MNAAKVVDFYSCDPHDYLPYCCQTQYPGIEVLVFRSFSMREPNKNNVVSIYSVLTLHGRDSHL